MFGASLEGRTFTCTKEQGDKCRDKCVAGTQEEAKQVRME
jgi:hypothetical protein